MANTNEVLAVANGRYESEVANGNIQVLDSFSGNTRNIDVTNFEAGDTFTITGNEKKYRQKMGTNNRGEDTFAEWAVVEVHNGDMVTAKNFYIKSVLKIAIEYDQTTKKRKARRTTSGTLVDLARKFIKNEDLWKAIVGKTITIPEVNEVYTVRYDSQRKAEKTEADFVFTQLPVYNVSK